MRIPDSEDRIAGCLFAGAIGDSIGSRFEGMSPPVRFAIPDELRITDDTQLTIATCEAIVETGFVSPECVASHFARWYRERRISGIGSSTLKALRDLDAGGHWALVGASGERSAGNGAAMRIAPLAFLLDPDDETNRRTIRDVCRITHRNDEAYLGALTIVRSIRHVICGRALDANFFPALIDTLPDCSVRDRLIAVRDSDPSIREYTARFGATGYVVDSVPLAILAAVRSNNLLETIEEIVQCDGDTDTISSMFGQIYGAANGTKSLPMEIVDQIDEVILIRETVRHFSRTFESL